MNPDAKKAYEYANAKDWESAFPLFERAAAVDPSVGNYWYWMGQISRFRGDLNEAIEYLHKAIERDPKEGANHRALGLAYQELNRYEDSINAFLEAIKLDDQDIYALNSLGITYKRYEKYDEAREAYSRAMNSLSLRLGRYIKDRKDVFESKSSPAIFDAGSIWTKLMIHAATVIALDDGIEKVAFSEMSSKAFTPQLWVDRELEGAGHVRLYLPNWSFVYLAGLCADDWYVVLLANLAEVCELQGDRESYESYLADHLQMKEVCGSRGN